LHCNFSVISGADSKGIETYAQGKLEWLQQFLALLPGIPSHDTIARAQTRPQAFEQCFQRWVEVTETMGVQVIPIDGKTVRQSLTASAGKKQFMSRQAHRLV